MLMASAGTRERPSLWRHLSTGRYIVESGLPRNDPFTVLGSKQTWGNPSWLYDLVLYLVYVGGGTAGLIVARILLVSALALVLLLPARRAGSSALVLSALVAVPAVHYALNLSPMLPGMIILGAFAATLKKWEQQRPTSAIWWLAGIQILWANTTSTFILGPLVVMFRWIGAAIDDWSDGSFVASRACHGRYLLAFLATGISSCATPFGVATIRSSWFDCFAAFAISADGQSLVPGLVPLWSIIWSNPSSIAFAILVAAALFSGLFPTIRFRALLATLFLSVLAVADTRLLPLSAVWLVYSTQQALCGAFLREPAANTATRPSDKIRWPLRALTLVATGWVGLSLAGPARDGLRRIERQFAGTTTVEARLRWLAEGKITGSVLPLDPTDAGWLVWGNPKLRPVLDDRCELFADHYSTYRRLCLDVVQDRQNTYRRTDGSLGGWRQFANVVPFDWIVTRSTDVETNRMLNSSLPWGPVYWDAEVVIFGHEQNEQVAAAAKRLQALKSLGIHGVDHVPELTPGRRDHNLLILDDQSWKNYTTREFVDLARVYYSLDLPLIAEYLIMRLDDSSLARETDEWLHSSNRLIREQSLELQDPPD